MRRGENLLILPRDGLRSCTRYIVQVHPYWIGTVKLTGLLRLLLSTLGKKKKKKKRIRKKGKNYSKPVSFALRQLRLDTSASGLPLAQRNSTQGEGAVEKKT